ncbi:MAG: hypothetical protein U1E45_14810 [Geminicoccaceae bacterium]
MRRPALTLLLALAALPTAAFADEITDQLDQAKQYYQQGDIPGAISELDFVMQAMKGKIGQVLLETFPEPPAGWTAAPVTPGDESSIPIVGGSVLTRTYSGPDNATIKATLMSGGGFLQGLAGMFMNPTVMAAQPGAKRVRLGRETATATYDPTDKSSRLLADIGGKATLMLEGTNVPSSDSVVTLGQAWDLKRVKELVGG